MFDGAKDAVDRSRRNFRKFFKDPEIKGAEFLLVSREPDRENGFKAFGARKVSGHPDFFEYGKKFGLIVFGFRTWFSAFDFPSSEFEGTQAPYCILAVIVTSGTEFVEDLRFFFAGSFFIT